MRQFAHNLWTAVAGTLYPECCCGCEVPLQPTDPQDYCPACWQELPLLLGAACQRCGAPASDFYQATRCPHCQKHPVNFDRAIAAGGYDGLLRRQVLEAKHAAGSGLAAALGRLMMRRALPLLGAETIDVVTCVPMHWRRRVMRRHSLAESLGQVASATCGKPFASRLLRWSRLPRKQAELPVSPRRANVRGALAVHPGAKMRAATVLLVDDVLTTGATCSEAAAVLKRAGAARVVAVVLARSL